MARLGRLVVELATNSARFVRGIESVDARLARFGKNASRIGKLVGAAFVIREVVDLGQKIVETSDKYKLLEGRLKLVQREGETLAATQDKLLRVANATKSDVASTTDLYTRFARTTKELNISQDDLLTVTTAVNQAIKVSGANSESANAAIIQLSQGMASGVLRGEELNSVMEQTPRLAQAIAEGLGVTIGQLRELGKEGQLTSEKVFKALITQSDVISREYKEIPDTVGTSLQLLKTELEGIAKGFSTFNALVLKGVKNLTIFARSVSEFVNSGERAAEAQRLFREQIEPNIELLHEYAIRTERIDPSNLDQVNNVLARAAEYSLDLVKNARFEEITAKIAELQEKLPVYQRNLELIRDRTGENSAITKNYETELKRIESAIDAQISKYVQLATAKEQDTQKEKQSIASLARREQLLRENFSQQEKLNNELLRLESLRQGELIGLDEYHRRLFEINKQLKGIADNDTFVQGFSGIDTDYTEQLKADHDGQQQRLAQNRAFRLELFRTNVKYKEDQEKLERQHRDFVLDNTANLFGALASLTGQGSRKAFELSKKLARAQTIVSTYSAAQKAYESQIIPGDPSSFVRATLAASVAVAAGLARLAAINRTSFGGASAAAASTGAGSFVPSSGALNTPGQATNPATGQTFVIIAGGELISESQLDALLGRMASRINEGSQIIIRRDSVQAQEIARAVNQ